MAIIKNIHKGNHHALTFKKQSGAALLALMLIIIVGSSFYLATKLNTNLALTQQSKETGIALKSAKDALIGYAITFPDHDTSGVVDGPGYLPCPDLNNDGSAVSSCSAGGGTTIGRLPNQTLRLEELRDASGQRLWYALSENFRFGSNKTVPLNSESPASAELSVNGVSDIVAVIIAPGEPVGAQDRDTDEIVIANEIANYLEDDNSDLDTSFVTTANIDLNDRLMVITRQELMQAMEKRVLGEANQILGTYYNSQGAYPWLTPFSDPKMDARRLTGTASNGSDSTTLIDTSNDFAEWGVVAGDIVRNATDGSIGFVSSRDSSSQLTIAGMSLGTENDFDEDDVYHIQMINIPTTFSGTATIGSSGLLLEDTTKDFDDLSISAGDIFENVTDGSSGVIISVADDEIVVASLSGGAENDIDNSEVYLIRANSGTVTSASTTTLIDIQKDFISAGIAIGDLVQNITDGSYGAITGVAATSLTVNLELGSENDFDIGDIYSVSRFNPVSGTREGHLSFHEPGEPFQSGFLVDWSTTGATNLTISGAGNSADYYTGLASAVAASVGTTSTSINVGLSDGVCVWSQPDIAECYGEYTDTIFFSGTATAGTTVAGNSKETSTLVNSNADFLSAGVKSGDKINNVTDGTEGIVNSVSNATTLLFNNLRGNPDVNLNSGDDYRVYISTSSVDGVADQNHQDSGNNVIIKDTTKDFTTFVEVGDVIKNTKVGDGGGLGKISAVAATEITATKLNGELDSADDHIHNGESYTIYHDYVEERKYTYRLRFNGFSEDKTSGEIRIRDVCVGYDVGGVNDCDDTAPSNVALDYVETGATGSATVDTDTDGLTLEDTTIDFLQYKIQPGYVALNTTDGSSGIISSVTSTQITVSSLTGGTNNVFIESDDYKITIPWVKITDTDDDNDQAGIAYLSIPTSGATGNIKVAGMDYYLHSIDVDLNNDGDYDDAGDIAPDILPWFIHNNWHQLLYIAYSTGDSPGGGATCTVGTNCLTFTGGGAPINNKRAIVIGAGEPLATQDRATGVISSYYEGGNNSAGDNNFQTGEITGAFNEQFRILSTSP